MVAAMEPVLLKPAKHPFQASVLRVGDQVWKDYRAMAHTWRAPLGRWLVRREARAMARLPPGSCPGLIAHADPLVLAMEHVNGRCLAVGDEAQVRQLIALVERMHLSGIVHNDLHHSNVMVRHGQIVLLDFTASIHFPRWLRWAGWSFLAKRDMEHAHKLLARSRGQATPRSGMAWLARGWKRIYRKAFGAG